MTSKSERRDTRGSSQWGSSTSFVSSKFEQSICSDPLQGSEIITRPSSDPSWSESSINITEDTSGRTQTMTISGACFRCFTMQPKVGIVTYLNAKRLTKHGTLTHFFSQQSRHQMSPPSLIFTRVARFSVDVVIRFTLRTTEQQIYTPQGRIFMANGLVPRMRANARRRKSCLWT